MGYIYCITNNITNKKYIGKTSKTIEERFSEHIKESRRINMDNSVLHRSIRKYGIEHFQIECVGECDNSLLDEKEKFYISKFGTLLPVGYNMTAGGDGITGYKHTEKTLARLRENTSRVMKNLSAGELAERSHKISEALSGKPKSPEHRQALSKRRKELFESGKLVNSNTGVPMSEEQKEKLRVANTGKISSRRIPLRCNNESLQKEFNSYMEASLWLIENGHTKSKNRTSVTTTIKESITSGNKRYGFTWKLI